MICLQTHLLSEMPHSPQKPDTSVLPRVIRISLSTCSLFLAASLVGCGGRNTVRTDFAEKRYSCILPEPKVNGNNVTVAMFESMKAISSTTDQYCRKASWLEASARKGELGSYVALGVLSFGLFPFVDATTTVITGGGEHKVCDKPKVDSKPIEEKLEAAGTFQGRLLIVPVNFPDAATERVIDGQITSISLPVKRSDSAYAVQVKGTYKSANVQCDVELQQIVTR